MNFHLLAWNVFRSFYNILYKRDLKLSSKSGESLRIWRTPLFWRIPIWRIPRFQRLRIGAWRIPIFWRIPHLANYYVPVNDILKLKNKCPYQALSRNVREWARWRLSLNADSRPQNKLTIHHTCLLNFLDHASWKPTFPWSIIFKSNAFEWDSWIPFSFSNFSENILHPLRFKISQTSITGRKL